MTEDLEAPPSYPAPSPQLGAAALWDAAPLDWTFAPATPLGDALARAITAQLVASEGRGRKRGEAEAGAFSRAIGAILGSALEAWARGLPVSHSRKASAFTGKPVGARTALSALDALTRAGLLHHHLGYRRQVFPGAYEGRASRWWPSAALIALAEQHGVAPQGDAFRRVRGEAFAPDPEDLKVVLKPLKGETALRVLPSAEFLAAAQQDLDDMHARCGAVRLTGCPPPAFSIVFIGGPGGHGRFHAQGAGGSLPYQQMPEADRLRLTFDGSPVAEVDMRASHLAILHGLKGASQPAGDAYDIPGVPREAVKAFIVQTLGTGAPAARWSKDVSAVAGLWPSLPIIREAVLDRYPLLRDPAAVVPEEFLPGAPRKRALTHYLTGIEAKALNSAMRVLWQDGGVVALPMHDGLIVPRTAAKTAADALRLGYLIYADVEPEAEAAWWEDGRKATEML